MLIAYLLPCVFDCPYGYQDNSLYALVPWLLSSLSVAIVFSPSFVYDSHNEQRSYNTNEKSTSISLLLLSYAFSPSFPSQHLCFPHQALYWTRLSFPYASLSRRRQCKASVEPVLSIEEDISYLRDLSLLHNTSSMPDTVCNRPVFGVHSCSHLSFALTRFTASLSQAKPVAVKVVIHL